MINFWLSLWRRRNDPPKNWSYHGVYSPGSAHILYYHTDWPTSVRIVQLPYDHEANGDFR